MAKILNMPKRLTQPQAHDYVSAQHRTDDFDPKAHTWSRVIFYILIIAMIAGILAWKEAKACGEMPEPMEPIKVVNSI